MKSMKSCNVISRCCWVRNVTRSANNYNTACRRFVGHSVKWGRRSQSLGIRSGIACSIQARHFVRVHICSPSPHSMWRRLGVFVLSLFLHASVGIMHILKSLTLVGKISCITLYHAALVASVTGASQGFSLLYARLFVAICWWSASPWILLPPDACSA